MSARVIHACLGSAVLLLASCSSFQDVPRSPPEVHSTDFQELLAQTARAGWLPGNRITTLVNGDAFFPPMLEAIRSARKTITFETFVYKAGRIGRQFSVAFAEAARRGVEVHVLLDANGSRGADPSDIAMMKETGVHLHLYRPFNALHPLAYNHRTHRKIMVVDGHLAYTGGAGYTDIWIGNAQSSNHWRDTQYEIRGPVVRQLQQGFMENWLEVTGKPLTGPAYFPPLSRAGPSNAQFSLGSPDRRGDTLGSSILLSINAARKSILIAHGYFIPNRELVEALLRARHRGVRIEIIVCGEHTDFPICRLAQRPALRKLHRAGVRIWEYTTTMMHGKLLVVDDHLSVVGSANFDDRSFFINDEANLHVLDPRFAREQAIMFEHDKQHCRPLTDPDLRLRPDQLPAQLATSAIRSQL